MYGDVSFIRVDPRHHLVQFRTSKYGFYVEYIVVRSSDRLLVNSYNSGTLLPKHHKGQSLFLKCGLSYKVAGPITLLVKLQLPRTRAITT